MQRFPGYANVYVYITAKNNYKRYKEVNWVGIAIIDPRWKLKRKSLKASGRVKILSQPETFFINFI